MATKRLTAKSIELLKPRANRVEIADAAERGLYFIVQPSGAKSWAVRYRHQGRTRKLTLGSYPALELVEARETAHQALRKLAKGKPTRPWRISPPPAARTSSSPSPATM